ncbi:MAG: BACON domain-containing protein, partial [Odoribacteraceae bacterium]|nr:BACON domain-containing protein [Odoribacteraceae bacterium]
MKRIATYLLPLVALLAACGVEEHNGSYDATRVFIESANVSNFPPSGGSGTIILANDEKVTVTSDQPWCRVTGNAGKTISITVDTTTSLSERTALVTIAAGERRAYLPVTQFPVYIVLESENIGFSARGGTEEIAYETPVNFTVTSDQSWCRVSVDGDKLVVNAGLNEQAARTATISFHAGERSRAITVVQRQPTLELGNATPGYLAAAGSVLKVPYDCILPVECLTTSNWFSTTIEGDTLFITA